MLSCCCCTCQKACQANIIWPVKSCTSLVKGDLATSCSAGVNSLLGLEVTTTPATSAAPVTAATTSETPSSSTWVDQCTSEHMFDVLVNDTCWAISASIVTEVMRV